MALSVLGNGAWFNTTINCSGSECRQYPIKLDIKVEKPSVSAQCFQVFFRRDHAEYSVTSDGYQHRVRLCPRPGFASPVAVPFALVFPAFLD